MSTFRPPSPAQRALLERAHNQYRTRIHSAAGFLLDERGMSVETAVKWGLGVVESPTPIHEQFRGRLSIPFYNLVGVVALQFRCLAPHRCKDHNCPKYLFPAKQQTTLFNLPALETPSRTIHITEGALDAIVLAETLNAPTVGVPSSDAWQPHWPKHFTAFDHILLWQDGDEAGDKMAAKWRERIGAEIVKLPDGEDVTSLHLAKGPDGIKELHP